MYLQNKKHKDIQNYSMIVFFLSTLIQCFILVRRGVEVGSGLKTRRFINIFLEMDPLLHLFIANLCVAGRVKASSSSSSSSSKWSSSWLWSSGDSCIFVNRKPMQICSCRVPIGKQPSTSFQTHNMFKSELLKFNPIITDW